MTRSFALPALVLAGATAGAGATAEAEAKTRSIYLSTRSGTNVSKACLNTLSGTLKDALGRAQRIRMAKNRAEADVVVEVEHCRIATVVDAHGAVDVTGGGGGDTRIAKVAASASTGIPTSMATVRIEAATLDTREEFTPGQPAPTSEAMSYVVGALVQWVEAQP